MMEPPVIDAHQHFWDVNRFAYPWMTGAREALRCNYLPQHLRPLLAGAGVSRTVVVQAHPSVAESRWLLDLSEGCDFVAGVVGWVDFFQPGFQTALDELQSRPKFKGIRHLIEAEPDERWMVRPEVLAGLRELERRGIPYDLLVLPRHLKYVPVVREHCPSLKLIVDHLAKPPIASGAFDEWARDLAAVAALPNVWCKLSGMITEANWKSWRADDLRPYVRHAAACFGSDRLVFGSDWPVCTLAGSYQQVVRALRDCLGSISPQQAANIWGGNAANFYGLC
jgi:L-fuconolactonase